MRRRSLSSWTEQRSGIPLAEELEDSESDRETPRDMVGVRVRTFARLCKSQLVLIPNCQDDGGVAQTLRFMQVRPRRACSWKLGQEQTPRTP